jgi:DNA-binding transcriptional ArsR family regulator
MGGVQRDLLLQEGMDNKLGILSKRQRRLILLTLKHGEEKTESDMLFRGGDKMDDAELQLIHNHLPRLEEAGYIDWDRDTGTISKGSRYDEIKPLLDLMENHADELPPDWP